MKKGGVTKLLSHRWKPAAQHVSFWLTFECAFVLSLALVTVEEMGTRCQPVEMAQGALWECPSQPGLLSLSTRLSGLNNTFFSVWEAGSPRSRYWQVWFLPRLLSLAHRWPPSPWVLMWPLLCVRAFPVSSSSCKDTSTVGFGPHPVTSFNFNYILTHSVSIYSRSGG